MSDVIDMAKRQSYAKRPIRGLRRFTPVERVAATVLLIGGTILAPPIWLVVSILVGAGVYVVALVTLLSIIVRGKL